jgi:hypothetical protein
VQNPCDVPRDRCADHELNLTANYSTTDLTAVVGYPNHAAQLVVFYNANTSVESVVYVDVRGRTQTKPIPPGQHYPVETGVASLDSTSGANISADCYWWSALGHEINEA